jgi:serine protease Do
MLRNLLRLMALGFVSLPMIAHAAPESFAPIVEPLMPAVVNISTTQKVTVPGVPMFNFQGLPGDPQSEQFKELFRQFGERFGGGDQEREVTSLGSGFVIDPQGFVVTNNHVVANADQVEVIFSDNTRLPAKIVGRDAKTDLALLKVTSSKPLVAVPFGDSDALRVGDWVIAVGNPFGLGGSVSAGIVSARGRNINAGPFDDFIQTDAAINRGNSGGPLFNTKGEVVGINSAIFSPTGTNIGIGFAVPTSLGKPVIEQLKQYGRAHRAWLGVKIQEVNKEIAEAIGLKEPKGALVLEISAKSPAQGSGLQAGDVILKFNGREIKEMRHLPRAVAESKIGQKTEVIVFRKGKQLTLQITLGEQPADADEPSEKAEPIKGKGANSPSGMVLGMKLVPITSPVRAQYNLPATAKGLLVTELKRDSDVAKQGVRPGDIILDVNQNAVADAKAVQTQVAAVKESGREQVLIRVARGEAVQFITVPVK